MQCGTGGGPPWAGLPPSPLNHVRPSPLAEVWLFDAVRMWDELVCRLKQRSRACLLPALFA